MGVIEEEKHIEKEAEVLELPQSMIQENEEQEQKEQKEEEPEPVVVDEDPPTQEEPEIPKEKIVEDLTEGEATGFLRLEDSDDYDDDDLDGYQDVL